VVGKIKTSKMAIRWLWVVYIYRVPKYCPNLPSGKGQEFFSKTFLFLKNKKIIKKKEGVREGQAAPRIGGATALLAWPPGLEGALAQSRYWLGGTSARRRSARAECSTGAIFFLKHSVTGSPKPKTQKNKKNEEKIK
jgi:hypothetical protein